MTRPLSLLFGVHAHQPAGNFPEVLERAHERCYGPFLRILHRYPDFRFAVHFSGPLLDYLFERHSSDMRLLEEMVARGQVEMFGAGDTEPVLASIPYRDRCGQIEKLSTKLARRFGQVPMGAWLTERVWETTVVPALAQSGIRYVTVDDYHFLCTGKAAAQLDGYFTTEEDGDRLDLFPISEALRYRFPFSPAEQAVEYLERLAREGNRAAVYFDDIEKFGIWPETYEWVYERRWLESFLERVLASRLVVTRTYGEFHASHRTRGIVYLPTTSYVEMNEWTLPASAAHTFAGLVQRAKQSNTIDVEKPFLRGGIWKNFLSRYGEANWMHKRMMALSRRLEAVAPESGELRDLLYRAQANDAYWHGLFGGVYLPHLRRGIYNALVELEKKLDEIEPRPAWQALDIDLDGIDEVFLHTPALQAVVKLDGRAAVCELDAYALNQNFGDTLRRYEEHYHRKAMHMRPAEPKRAEGIASAHDRFHARHDIAPGDLVPDPHARAMFLDTWIGADGARRPLQNYRLAPVAGPTLESGADADEMPRAVFEGELEGVSVRKHLSLRDACLTVHYRVESQAPGRFEVALDVAMPCCDGFAGRFLHAGDVLGGFGDLVAVDETEAVALDDRYLDGSLTLRASRGMRVAARPHMTVSQSEDGLEKIMQSVTLVVSWAAQAGSSEMRLDLEARAGEAPDLAVDAPVEALAVSASR